MVNKELKLYICTEELQNAINYLDCRGHNFIDNDTKKDLTPCCQTWQLIEQLAKFIFILINK